jgi:3-oxoacyl-[acyl-carrier protein] reductase
LVPEKKGGRVGRLDGRVAVVTGAGRGIGAAEAVRLAQDGANVAVFDLTEEACRETVEAVEAVGSEALAVACDVSKVDQVDAGFAKVAERFGRWISWSTTRACCGTTSRSR